MSESPTKTGISFDVLSMTPLMTPLLTTVDTDDTVYDRLCHHCWPLFRNSLRPFMSLIRLFDRLVRNWSEMVRKWPKMDENRWKIMKIDQKSMNFHEFSWILTEMGPGAVPRGTTRVRTVVAVPHYPGTSTTRHHCTHCPHVRGPPVTVVMTSSPGSFCNQGHWARHRSCIAWC